MKNKAIAHLTDQAMALDDLMMTMVEERLTGLCISDSVAEKLLSEGKSLKELKKVIWDEARKHRSGNSAVLDDSHVYKIAEDYYGIKNDNTESELIDITDYL